MVALGFFTSRDNNTKLYLFHNLSSNNISSLNMAPKNLTNYFNPFFPCFWCYCFYVFIWRALFYKGFILKKSFTSRKKIAYLNKYLGCLVQHFHLDTYFYMENCLRTLISLLIQNCLCWRFSVFIYLEFFFSHIFFAGIVAKRLQLDSIFLQHFILYCLLVCSSSDEESFLICIISVFLFVWLYLRFSLKVDFCYNLLYTYIYIILL